MKRIILSLLTSLTFSSLALAQTADPPTALQALERARRQAHKAISKVVRLTGTHGNPGPPTWTILFLDPASSTNLSLLEPSEAPQPAEDQYSRGTSPDYCSVSRIKIDSPAAFTLANQEAAEAKVGFDQITFELRAQEFTGMPVWTLRLLNADEAIVGIIHLSAESGKVLRTIWIRRDGRSEPRIIDSALPTEEKPSRELPPVQNIEVPPPVVPDR